MKKKEVPQDKSALENFTREVYYVKNENGKYDTELSSGWEAKTEALDKAWDDIKERVDEAKAEVLQNKKSPVYFFMIKNLMDVALLSSYSGFKKRIIKKHFKPEHFRKLENEKLEIYAKVFKINIEELTNFEG